MTDSSVSNEVLQAENARLQQRITELEQTIQTMQAPTATYEQELADCRAELTMYKTLVEHAPDNIVIMSPERVITYANPAACAMMGYGDALTGMQVDAIYAEDPDVLAQIGGVIDQSGFWRGVIQQKTQRGDILKVQATIFLITDADGQVQAIGGIGRDVTEQMQTAEALRASEARLCLMVQKMPVMIAAVGSDGNIVFWNEACEAVTGYQADEIIGNPNAMPLLLGDMYDQDIVTESVQPLAEYCNLELPIRTKAGDTRVIVWTSLADECPIPGWARWGVGIDITERKQAEESYHVLVEHSLQALLIYQDERIVFVNPATSTISGYTSEELLVMTVEELRALLHPEDRVRMFEHMYACLTDQAIPPTYEFRFFHKDGAVRWAEVFASRIEYRGKPAFQMAYVDITERKAAEQARQQIYAELQRVLTSVSACLWSSRVDARGHIGEVFLSPVVETLTGYPPSFFLGNSARWLDITYPDDVAQRRQAFNRLITGQSSNELFDYRIRRADGTIRWLRDDIVVERSNGHQRRLHGVTFDVTASKQAEVALREREALYRAMFETNRAIKLLIDPETGAIKDANRSASNFYGYSPDELRRMSIYDINLLSSEQTHTQMQRTLIEEHTYFLFQHRLASGEVRDVEVYSSPVEVRGQMLLFSIIHDITERKQIERALRQSEARYRQIVETAEEGIWLIDADNKTSFVNRKFADMVGYMPDILIGKSVFAFFDREDQVRTAAMLSLLRQGYPEQYEARLQRQDGTRLAVLLNTNPLSNHISHYQGGLIMVTDITGRKQTEEALRASETRFRAVWETATDAMVLSDAEGIVLLANPSYFELYGYTPDAVIGQTFAIIFPAEERAEAAETYRRVFHSPAVKQRFESVVRHANGTMLIMETHVDFLVQDGQRVAMLSVIRDITERKRLEEELHHSRAMLQSFLDHSPSAMAVKDLQGRYLIANRRMAELLQCAPEQLIGQDDSAFLPPDVIARWQTRNRQAFATGQPIEAEETLVLQGELRSYLLTAFPLFDPDRGIAAVGSITTDITGRKQAEAALEQQRLFLRQVLDINPNLIFARDRNGHFTLVNQTLADMYGTTVEYLSGKTDADLNPNLKEVQQIWEEDQEVLRTGREKVVPERFIQGVAGWERWLSIVKRPIMRPDGTADQVLVVGTDITLRKQTEIELQHINELHLHSIQELEQHNREITLLNEMGDYFQACLNVDEAYQTVKRFAFKLFQGQPGGLYMLNQTLTTLDAVSTWGDLPASMRLLMAEACWALRLGRPYTTLHSDSEPPCAHQHMQIHPVYICVPIVAQGETLGVFRQYIGALPSPEHYAQLARTVARQIALALANLSLRDQLYQQAIRDPLTRLFNRRYLEESFAREVHQAGRHQHAIGVIMLDIDHFKQINDTYDHDTGDTVLRMVGELLQTQTRGGDIVCRYGGEEFILVLPDAALEATQQRAELLRQEISSLTIKYAGHVLEPITASLGVAVFPQHGTTVNALIRAADTALYRAKAAGRNQVQVAEALSDEE
ncbi:MAG: PAS domain S-box protein [Chloroflexaceae bacterium]